MLYLIRKTFIIFILLQTIFANAQENDHLEQIDNFCESTCYSLNDSVTVKQLTDIEKANKLIDSFEKRIKCIKPVFTVILLNCLTLYYFNIDNSTTLLKTAAQIFFIDIIFTIMKSYYVPSDFFHSFVEFYQLLFDFYLPIYAGLNISHTVESAGIDKLAITDYLAILLVQISSVANTLVQWYYHVTEDINLDDVEDNNKLNFLQRCIQDKKEIYAYFSSLKQDYQSSIFFKKFCEWINFHEYENKMISEYERSNKNKEITNTQFNIKISKISQNETLVAAMLASFLEKNSYLLLEASTSNDEQYASKFQYIAIANHGEKYFVILGETINGKLLKTTLLNDFLSRIRTSRTYISIIIKFDSADELFNYKKEISNYFGSCINTIDIFKFTELTE